MTSSRSRARLLALLSGVAVAATALMPVAPAVAQEAAGVTESPTASAATVTYRGTFQRLARQDANAPLLEREMRFFVPGQGALKVDVSAIDLGVDAFDTLTLRLAVPEGLELADDAADGFRQLAASSFTTGALPAVEKVAATDREVSSLVNVSPVRTAVHRVYAVLVNPVDAPASSPAPEQTDHAVAAAVDHASEYWRQQSSGKVTFDLAGVVPWYSAQAGGTCTTENGYDLLWAEAAQKASKQLGFEFGANEHLVLFFPSTTNCGFRHLGAASIGDTVNTGGVSWVVGTDAPIALHTLKQQLGSNMSLGRAGWSSCNAPEPSTEFAGPQCPTGSAGDPVDVMGERSAGRTGGALSAPSAIRSGLWSADAYSVARQGTTTYTLDSVSSNSGRRAVVIEATSGANFFLEYRNRTDEDAQYADGVGCVQGSWSCAEPTDGIRVVRLEQRTFNLDGEYYTFKGFPGDATYVLGRTIGDRARVHYTAGEVFTAPGIEVTVDSVAGDQATVTVTRSAASVVGSYVTVMPSDAYDEQQRVGDTWTAFLEADWRAESYGYQWYRNGVAITGATKQSYTLSSADLGKYVCVKVAGKTPGATTRYAYDPGPCSATGYGPIQRGVLDGGTVSIDASATPLRAVLAGWSTPNTSFAYQWYRGSTPIAGATKSAYTPTQSDRGAALRVRVSGSRAGFLSAGGSSSLRADSPARSYDVQGTGVTLSGDARVGRSLSVSTPSFSVDGEPVEATVTYRWFRGTRLISGAVGSTYTLTAADLGAKVTAQVIGSVPGRVAWAPKTAASAAVRAGTIDLGSLTVTKAETGMKLTATFPGYATAGTTRTYQWYRGTATAAAPIKGATKSSYTLTAADAKRTVWVVVVAKKAGYNAVKLTSAKLSYTLLADPTVPVIEGQPTVGSTLSVAPRQVIAAANPIEVQPAYQWYRGSGSSHTPITGATAATYTPTDADLGKTLRVKVTLMKAGWFGSTGSSIATAPVAGPER